MIVLGALLRRRIDRALNEGRDGDDASDEESERFMEVWLNGE
jgi:hypothetical protein